MTLRCLNAIWSKEWICSSLDRCGMPRWYLRPTLWGCLFAKMRGVARNTRGHIQLALGGTHLRLGTSRAPRTSTLSVPTSR